ncbi:response regulator [Pseudomonas sp. S32]|uniref:response regulator n=1 Tax=Pseudomonas sp. S32 TaxID=2767448 RepID=UPI001912165F|nr:response regulator [Pseudomonas sp. S32]MBK5004279.1 response regulator [Pseudomonas sp. S32]
MASTPALDHRALILAPQPVAAETSRLLASAGIDSLCAVDLANLHACLAEGAGLAIIAEQAFVQGPCLPLQAFIDEQPCWSDLPIVLMLENQASLGGQPNHPTGNLIPLISPFAAAQLLHITQSALRHRKKQYSARDQLRALQLRLDTQDALAPEATSGSDFARHQARKMEAIGQLAGGVAHDFNNLLTSIGGSFELIDRRLKQDRREGLGGVVQMGRDAVTRAARLTHRLLAFSSRQSLHSQRVDLHAMLQHQPRNVSTPPAVTLFTDVPDDLWPVEVDGQQLQEALDNLLLNACEAMPSGGRLRIEATNQHVQAGQFPAGTLSAGDYVHLRIIDDGQGMAQSTLEHAFEPFFSTKAIGQGIGLGLSMVYGFSKQSHGHATLRSRVGHGTEVGLYLPRYLERDPGHAESAQTLQPSGGHHVLVVEDDPDVRQLLCQALEDEGFSCCTAGNAAEGLSRLRSGEPVDLLITDVGLPGMNGRQLAEIARSMDPQLPVLFITGYAETAMAREGFLGPGMHLIGKPFELQQLQAYVIQILGRP